MQTTDEQRDYLINSKSLQTSYYYRNRAHPVIRLPNFIYQIRDFLFKFFTIKISFLDYSIGYYLAILSIIIIGCYIYINIGITTKYWASGIIGLTFLFTIKNSFLITLTGFLYQTQVKIHKILAILGFILGFKHGLYHLRNDGYFGLQQYSGLVMLSSIGCLILTGIFFTFFYKLFRYFIFLHRLFFLSVCVCAYLHGAYNIYYYGVFWVFLDIFLRFVIVIKNAFLLRSPTVEIIEKKYIVLKYKKSKYFTFQEGQFCYLYSFFINPIELHPFSICSSNNEAELKFIIKIEKNWTKSLSSRIEKNKIPYLLVDGSYGGSMLDIWDTSMGSIVLVSGGVGVTPMLSYAKFFLNQIQISKPIKKVFFYWISRDLFLYEEIKSLIQLTKDYKDYFEFRLFTTGENHDDFVTKGRPVWNNEFMDLKIYSLQNEIKKTAVFVCGPNSLKSEVISFSKSHSDSKVSFNYNFEDFNPLYI